MHGTMITFAANGRTADGYLSLPPSGTGPGLVVVQEWWGLVDHIKDVADRFAAEGFVALAPDLYHGELARSPDEAGKLFMALNIAKAGLELRGAGTCLLEHPAVSPRKVGVVGFCMGGQLALFAAAEHGDVFSAVVDFYGVHPNAKVDPRKVKVPVLAHFAERDNSVPPAMARKLVAELVDAGAQVEAHFYDAGHAFFNDTRPQVYDRACAEQAWARTITFLRRELLKR
ncbi:MAG: dienelactone hydrolase family protein [Gemmatimonadota bacterium]